jgi:hypothetical protein
MEKGYESGPKMVQYIAQDDNFLDKFTFSKKATFHLSSKVNRQNVHMYETGCQRAVVEHLCDCPKVNAFLCCECFQSLWTIRLHGEQGQPKTYRRPGQTNNLAPFTPLFLNVFSLEQGWHIFLRARTQIADNFWRNSCVGNLSVPAPYFQLFQWRLSAPYRLGPLAATWLACPSEWPWWRQQNWCITSGHAIFLCPSASAGCWEWSLLTHVPTGLQSPALPPKVKTFYDDTFHQWVNRVHKANTFTQHHTPCFIVMGLSRI